MVKAGFVFNSFDDFYRSISLDIFAFAQAMNFKPTWQQKKLLAAVQTGTKKISVRSGQGPGKTSATVICGLWRLLKAEFSRLIITAPTMRQCKDVWLAEARLLLNSADPMIKKIFEITKTRVYLFGNEDWGAELVTASVDTNWQGYHRPNMSIIGEEASGIGRTICEAIEGTSTQPNALILLIGNPNTRDCFFYDTFHTDKHNWLNLRWNAELTPPSKWFDPKRNVELEEKYGRDSDVYRVRVLGEFPLTNPKCVIPLEHLEACSDKHSLYTWINKRREDRYGGKVARQVGMDFARFGGDENTFYIRAGYSIVKSYFQARCEPLDVIDEAFRQQDIRGWNNKQVEYIVDATGIGQGLLANFYRNNKRVHEFHNHGAPVDKQYDNKITEAYFGLAEILKTRECYIPHDDVLFKQLTNRQYNMTNKGLTCLESKDQYCRRGNDSPDRADALVLTMYDALALRGTFASGRFSSNTVGSKKDPYI